jgi:hypothetical protein
VFGYAADRTGKYWPITLFGYTLQMVVVPLLALAGAWPVAALLIVAERTGRAIRNPARDAMLAHATGELGRGWVFGVREALDAGGAMLGPLLVAAAIAVHGGYAGAMATEAVAALVLGRLFDRIGLLTVVGATVLTACFAPLVFLGGAALAAIGMVLWGLGMAAQESIVKAAITGIVGADRRASAYGLFDTGFGVCWFLGSAALGVLYDRSITALVIFSVVLQAAAIPLLLRTRQRLA